MATQSKSVHRLKVTLRQVKPPVWRRIEVPSSMKLSELASVLEGAMGWLGGHLHTFEAAGVIYEIPDDESFGFPQDGRRAQGSAQRRAAQRSHERCAGTTTSVTAGCTTSLSRRSSLHEQGPPPSAWPDAGTGTRLRGPETATIV